MASRITEIAVDSRDPARLAEFWCAVLDYVVLDLGAVPAGVGRTGEESWHVLADPEGNAFCLLRRRVDPA